MAAIQLDLFKSFEECEMDSLRHTIEQIRKSSENVRKGAFAKINQLTRESTDLRARLDILERNICKGIVRV